MPQEPVTGQAAALQSLIEVTAVQLEQTHSQMQEIEARLEENAAEFELLVQRNAQVSSYVRQFQTHLDRVPPAEICEGYEALLNTRQRMVALRGQMEQMKSEQRYLGRLAETQRQVLQLGSVPDDLKVEGQPPAIAGSAVIHLIEDEQSIRESLASSMNAGPITSLSNLILQAEICQRLFEASPARTRAELALLKRHATETFSSVRQAVLEIHPLSLADLGLVPAIGRLVESLQEENGMSIGLSFSGDERRFPPVLETLAFRAAHELLRNAQRHSSAGQVLLLVDTPPERISIVVEDNGVGFDVDDVFTANSRNRGSLMILKERAELMAGELNVRSSAGHGARVEFSIPAAI